MSKELKFNKILIAIVIIILLASTLLFIKWVFYEPSIKIGIVDSGISITELDSSIVDERSFVKTSYGYPETEKNYDLFGHGTQVYKIIKDNIPSNVPVSYYSAKITDRWGNVQREAFIDGVYWLANEKQVDIISMSLGGGPRNFDGYHHLFKDLAERGITLIAAAGNLGSFEIVEHGSGEHPAILPWVIGVGATNGNGELLSFSSIGKSYYNTYPNEVVEFGKSYDSNQWGTSFATPRITAKVAILLHYAKQKGVILNTNSVGAILARSTGESFSPTTGFGVPDLDEMIKLIGSDPFMMLYGGNENEIGENYIRFWNEGTSKTIQIRTYGMHGTGGLFYYYTFSSLDDIYTSNYDLKINTEDIFNQTITFTFEFDNLEYYEYDICYIDYGDRSIDAQPLPINRSQCDGNLLRSSYDFNIDPYTKILYDLETLVDLRYYEYGQLTDLTDELRSHGIQTDISYQLNHTDLNGYEVVFSPLILDRQYTDIEYLLSYVEQGGIWFATLGMNNENEDYYNLLSRFDLTIVDLANYMNGRNILIPNPATEFKQQVHFNGVGLTTTNNIHIPVGNISIYGDGPIDIKAGYIIKYGKGNIIIYGSNDSFTNQGLLKSNNQHLLNYSRLSRTFSTIPCNSTSNY